MLQQQAWGQNTYIRIVWNVLSSFTGMCLFQSILCCLHKWTARKYCFYYFLNVLKPPTGRLSAVSRYIVRWVTVSQSSYSRCIVFSQTWFCCLGATGFKERFQQLISNYFVWGEKRERRSPGREWVTLRCPLNNLGGGLVFLVSLLPRHLQTITPPQTHTCSHKMERLHRHTGCDATQKKLTLKRRWFSFQSSNRLLNHKGLEI